MRLFAKFFLCGTIVICIALLLSGYLLITFSHESAISRELERAVTQFQFDKFIVQSRMISSAGEHGVGVLSAWALELNGSAAFFDEDRLLLYSNMPQAADFSLLSDITGNYHVYQVQTLGYDSYIMIGGRLIQSDITLYMLMLTDISPVIALREQMTQSFAQVYFITLLASMVIIFVLSALLIRPINRMNYTAGEIARGRFDQRLQAFGNDEIGELSNSFNLMADAIEDKIYELLLNAQQKDEFVANFAHELKTPLTSVIGYADMLYHKNLEPDQVKNAAEYILNEGLRLEALSLKLMDLIVLNKQDFTMEKLPVKELLLNIAGSLKPLTDEKQVQIRINVQPCYIVVEYDLFKTLLLNLIDNAIKAGCTNIEISGEIIYGSYTMQVIDNGRGMPQEELTRITEAFYTVDKSRSRKQHGVGIGLALADRIAGLHGSKLEFASAEDVGTIVKFKLTAVEDNDE